MGIIAFLAQVVIISLSGVMAPGPVTATTIAMGARNRYAGTLVAIGHGIVEMPLIVLITLGLGEIFKLDWAKIAIGLAGGAMLIFMAFLILKDIKNIGTSQSMAAGDKAVLAGIVLTAGNPYFLVWWATVGLNLAVWAKGFGIWMFAIFAIVHWLCDLIWCQILSWASFKGATVFSIKNQKSILKGCSSAMFIFGVNFIFDAACVLFLLIFYSRYLNGSH
jgi:threonine/homoserine/homoserine lactone efflux protein